MGRKMKITQDASDRADQRARTEELAKKTSGMEPLQVTPPRFLQGYAYTAWRELVPLLNAAGLCKQVDKPLVIATKIKSLSDALGLSPQARASIVLDNQDDDDGPTLKQALKAGDKSW